MHRRVPMFVPQNSVPEKNTCQCPYCGKQVTLTPLAWTLEHVIYQCDNRNCQKSFYAKVKHTGTRISASTEPSLLMFDIIETYPKCVPEKHESIPPKIWDDYLEASKSFDAGSFKASVVMCRRMLQNVCLEHGAKNKDNNGNWIALRNQIKEAFPQKDYALIHAIADKIKYFGDYGAHPQDDNIDDVKQNSASEILRFSYKILEIAYITPWELEKLATENR